MNTIVLQTDYTKDKTSSYLASMETLIEDLNKKDIVSNLDELDEKINNYF